MTKYEPHIYVQSLDDYQIILHALYCAAKLSDKHEMSNDFRERFGKFAEHFIDKRLDIVCEPSITEESFNPIVNQQNRLMTEDLFEQLQESVNDKVERLITREAEFVGDGTTIVPVTVNVGGGDIMIMGLGTITINLAAIELDRVRAVAPALIGLFTETISTLEHIVERGTI